MLSRPRAVIDGVTICAGRGGAEQHRPDRDQSFAQRLDQVVGDVARVQRRHDQRVGAAGQPGVREDALAHLGVDRGVGVHLAVHLQVGIVAVQDGRRLAHLERRRVARGAEVGVRDERDLRRDAEALHLVGGEQRDLDDVFDGGIGVDMSVGDEDRSARHHQQGQRGQLAHAVALADDLADMPKMGVILADRAADHGVGVAAPQHHRADHGRARSAPRAAPGRATRHCAPSGSSSRSSIPGSGRRARDRPARHSRPGCSRRPRRSMRDCTTARRPIRIGLARPSSSAACTARSTRSSSPSV